MNSERQWLEESVEGVGLTRAELLAERAKMMRAVRAFFEGRQYLEVETPLMVPSPGTDVHIATFKVEQQARWLITSPEYQMKRLLSGGLPRIMQIAKCFRRGEVGQKHQPEFTMVEWYDTGASLEEMMSETEALVLHVAKVLGRSDVVHSAGAGFERITVREAFERYCDVSYDAALSDEDLFDETFALQIDPQLGGSRPCFLTHWPAERAALAKLHEDGQTAQRFELYVNGVELCNAYNELTDAEEQRIRLERDRARRAELGKPDLPIDERFLSALADMPNAAGNALGLDRLLMVLLGVSDIADIVTFSAGRL